jgi:hypothetical protein
MKPTFDIWFWLLVVWSFVAPYLYDYDHMKACEEHEVVNFEPWPFDSATFKCGPKIGQGE